MKELIDGIKRNLNSNGKAYILYPEREMYQFIKEAESQHLFLNKSVLVRNRKGDAIFRVMSQFSFHESEITKDEIIIRDHDNSYTNKFRGLLEEYYL